MVVLFVWDWCLWRHTPEVLWWYCLLLPPHFSVTVWKGWCV